MNERTNDPRTILPQVRRQQFDNFSPIQQQEKPIINRRLPIRPRTTTPRPAQPIQPVQPAQPAQFATFNQKHQDEMRQHQLAVENVLRLQQQQERQTNFQQQQQRQQPNFFTPVSTPVQQAPSNLVQEAGFASNVNLNTGSYTISYGR